MTHLRGERAIINALSQDQLHDQMLDRVYREFLEMPGLCLTCRQAQRFWELDEQWPPPQTAKNADAPSNLRSPR